MRYRELLDAAPDAIVVVNQAGTIVLVNAQTENLFGYPREELIGQRAEMLISQPFRAQHSNQHFQFVATRSERRMLASLELCGLRKDGSEFPAEIRISPLDTNEGLLVSSAIRDLSGRRRTEEDLRRLASIVSCSDDAIIGKTLEGIITSWNFGAERIYGYSATEAIGKPVGMLVPMGRADEIPEILERLKRGEIVDHFETLRVRKGGKEFHIEITASPIRDAMERIVGASTIGRDISDRKRREEDQSRLAAVVESSDDAIIGETLDGTITDWNSGAERIYGYSAAEIIGKPMGIVFSPDGSPEIIQVMEKIKRGERVGMSDISRSVRDGREIHVTVVHTPIRNAEGQVVGISTVARDVTENRRMQEQLEYNAFHDALTRLPNRTLFLDRLQRAMDHAKRYPQVKFAVLFVDIQGLKIFNETMGHTVVDQLIVDISNRLQGCLRHDDTISRSTAIGSPGQLVGDETLARMDGDQFTILLEGIKEPSEPMRVAIRVQESLTSPFTANGVDVFTFASIGIALSSPTFQKPAEMLRDADIAMCRAKAQGVSNCEVFDTKMHALVVRRLKLESELRRAIERNELRVLYQPIIHLATGRIAGVEALLRWWHDESKLVGPEYFIEVAEETGLIVPIGRWVLKEACRQAHAWHDLFPTDPLLTASVNVSPRQFAQSNLVADVQSALDESKVNPSSLQLEITESAAMSDPLKAASIFYQLKELGIRLSIDDFGTGHSSLGRLRGFPVDTLKIDRSFIRGMEQDVENLEVARLIITLAHHLHLKVIAEGIETPGQRIYLEQFGCEFGQGYLFSRPVDHDTIEDLLATSLRDSIASPIIAGFPIAS